MNKLWVFQSSRLFNDEELSQISEDLNHYLKQWKAHGSALKSQFEIKYNRFIIICADQSQTAASGCSIDNMTNFIKSLERKLNCSLLDRNIIAYKDANGDINTLPLKQFKEKVSSGCLSAETIIFNNAVNTLEEYTTNWEISIKDSWVKTIVK